MKYVRKTKIVKSRWSNNIYSCSEGCGFIGQLDAFKDGSCYNPCPHCGALRTSLKIGRFVYRVEPIKWLPFLHHKIFDHVEWKPLMNIKKYAVFPGYVISKQDGDRHFISYHKLIKLYHLDPAECWNVSIDSECAGRNFDDYKHIHPRYDGDYPNK